MDVDTTAGNVKVYVDGGPVLNWSGALNTTYGGMGFSSATGYAGNLQIIDNLQVTVKDPCTVSPSAYFHAPLTNGGTTNLSVNATLPISFGYGTCAGDIRDDSVVLQVVDMADPNGFPVTTWVMGFDITYDNATGTYHQDFLPNLYGLAAGMNLQVQVYMSGNLVGTAVVHLTP